MQVFSSECHNSLDSSPDSSLHIIIYSCSTLHSVGKSLEIERTNLKNSNKILGSNDHPLLCNHLLLPITGILVFCGLCMCSFSF